MLKLMMLIAVKLRDGALNQFGHPLSLLFCAVLVLANLRLLFWQKTAPLKLVTFEVIMRF